MGDYQSSTTESSEIVRRASSWTNHPQYNSGTNNNNDFAILKLSECVEFNDYVAPVCLPESSSSNFNGKPGMVTGWGTLSSGGTQPDYLQEVEVDINEVNGLIKKKGFLYLLTLTAIKFTK